MNKLKALSLAILLPLFTQAQGLGDLFGEESSTEYAYATFKSSRIINSQSIEMPADGNLLFIISHHFGALNSGAYNLFGLDQSTIRLGFEYGIGERLALGVGRSSYQKTFDGFIKYKILRQSTGSKKMPLSLSWYSDMVLTAARWADPDRENFFSSRMSYTHSLLAARKFSNGFSAQLMPTLVHKNLVPSSDDAHDILIMGAGARAKITQRTTLNVEYFYVLPDQIISSSYRNSLSIGFDIETGGHVFQLHFTNSPLMFSRGFLTETTGNWLDGDILFGFNITRTFVLKKPEEFK
jgi:hypothetical protein